MYVPQTKSVLGAMVVFGGASSPAAGGAGTVVLLNTLWILNPSSQQWLPTLQPSANDSSTPWPPARAQHTGAFLPGVGCGSSGNATLGSLLIHGGFAKFNLLTFSFSDALSDTWLFDFDLEQWCKIPGPALPGARGNHAAAAVYLGPELFVVVWGGDNGAGVCATGAYAFQASSRSWAPMQEIGGAAAGTPMQRTALHGQSGTSASRMTNLYMVGGCMACAQNSGLLCSEPTAELWRMAISRNSSGLVANWTLLGPPDGGALAPGVTGGATNFFYLGDVFYVLINGGVYSDQQRWFEGWGG